jgi:hypothetical protein
MSAAFLVAATVSGRALAVDKHACVVASDQGQALRLDGKLTEARERFLVCADPTCPSIVRTACAGWLEEVGKQIPTLVFSAHDSAGNDLVGLEITLDGKRLEGAADGRAIPMDPGTHKVTFSATGVAPVERIVVVREGEQRRIVEAVLGHAGPPEQAPAADAGSVGPPPSPQETPPPAEPATTQTPWAAWGFTIGAGVAWAAFGAFAVSGHLAYEKSKSDCPACGPYPQTQFVLADVSLGLAAAATVVAGVLFLTHHPAAAAAAARGPVLTLSF